MQAPFQKTFNNVVQKKSILHWMPSNKDSKNSGRRVAILTGFFIALLNYEQTLQGFTDESGMGFGPYPVTLEKGKIIYAKRETQLLMHMKRVTAHYQRQE